MWSLLNWKLSGCIHDLCWSVPHRFLHRDRVPLYACLFGRDDPPGGQRNPRTPTNHLRKRRSYALLRVGYYLLKTESFLESPSVMDSLRITNLWLCRFLAELVLLGPSQRHSTTPISNPHDNYSRNTKVLSPTTLERQMLHLVYFGKPLFNGWKYWWTSYNKLHSSL